MEEIINLRDLLNRHIALGDLRNTYLESDFGSDAEPLRSIEDNLSDGLIRGIWKTTQALGFSSSFMAECLICLTSPITKCHALTDCGHIFCEKCVIRLSNPVEVDGNSDGHIHAASSPAPSLHSFVVGGSGIGRFVGMEEAEDEDIEYSDGEDEEREEEEDGEGDGEEEGIEPVARSSELSQLSENIAVNGQFSDIGIVCPVCRTVSMRSQKLYK